MTNPSVYNPLEAIYSDSRRPDWEKKGAAILHLMEPVEGMDPIVEVAQSRSDFSEKMKELMEKGVRMGIHYFGEKEPANVAA